MKKSEVSRSKSIPSKKQVNSVEYWDHRFEGGWEVRGGPDQTRFFAKILVDALPEWIVKPLQDKPYSILDVGCALGDAYQVLKSAFLKATYVGVDVSTVGVRKAIHKFPDVQFQAINADWSNIPACDFAFSSNTLEHLNDWRSRIDLLCRCASHSVFVLVPYCEETLDPEHVARFDERSFLAVAGNKRLSFLKVVDTSAYPSTRWNGRQILAIYSPPEARRRHKSGGVVNGLEIGMDLRGLHDEDIEAALFSLSRNSSAPIAPASIIKVNSEWEEKFNGMIASFEAKHTEMVAEHQRAVRELESRLRNAVQERQEEIQNAFSERDTAKLMTELLDRKLFAVQELHSTKLAHLEEMKARENKLQQEAAELAFAKEALLKDHKLEIMSAKFAALQEQMKEVSASEFDSAAWKAERAALIEKHAVEIERLSSNLALSVEERRRLETDLTERLGRELSALRAEADSELSKLHTNLASLSEVKHELETERVELIAKHQEELNRLHQENASAVARFNDDLSWWSAANKRLEGERDALRRAHAEELSALRAESDSELSKLHTDLASLNEVRRELETERVELIAKHQEELNRLHQENASAVARFNDDLSWWSAANKRLEGERDALRRAHAEELSALRANHHVALTSANNSTALLISNLQTELDEKRKDVALHEDNATILRQHYERHLENINLSVDQVTSKATSLIDRLIDESDRRISELVMKEEKSANLAQVAIERLNTAQQGKLRNAMRSALRQVLGKTTDRKLVLELPSQISFSEVSIRSNPIVAELKHTFGELLYERNIAGATDFRCEDILKDGELHTIKEQHPVSKRDQYVVAMQLENFDQGGLEKVVFDLCCGFKDVGIQVLVICRACGLLGNMLRNEEGVEICVFDDEVSYQRLLEVKKVTHLFLHHSYFGFDLASKFGIKLFDVVHNTYLWKKADAAEVLAAGLSCARVICVSSAVREFHVKAFQVPIANTQVINNAINTSGLVIPEADQLRRIRSGLNQTTFLSVANFYSAKAHVPLVHAFLQAHRKYPGSKLLLAGTEVNQNIADEIRRIIEHHELQDVIILLGHTDRRQLSRYYAQSHAFLLPSIFEGYSVSAVEAATFGLPLIMTDVGGARDLIKDNDCGILLPPIVEDLANCTPDDIELISMAAKNRVTPYLVEAIISIAQDRNSWIERGFSGMSKPRSLSEMVADYLQVMEEVECPVPAK